MPKRGVLLVEDETDILLFPPLRSGWSRRGKPVQVRLCGKNERRVVFGAMNVRTGQRLFLARRHQRAGDFQALLEQVHSRYRGWHVTLLLDQDPSHTAASSLKKAEEFGIDLLWLPKRCPELNPMEVLWSLGKNTISANRQYAKIDQQVVRFIRFLRSLTKCQALKASGMLSERFWLHSTMSKKF